MDDEYFRRYARLHEMIRECYVDYYILLGMRNFINSSDKTGKIPNCFWGIINHHCRLTKEHLALILWKLTDDHQNKSNTIITLKTYLREKYGLNSLTLSKENMLYRKNKLTPIRKKMLAHNDIENSGIVLQVDELFNYLEDVRRVLNCLCHETIDNRVNPLLDTEIFNMGASYQLNQHLMYLHLSALYEDDAGDSN